MRRFCPLMLAALALLACDDTTDAATEVPRQTVRDATMSMIDALVMTDASAGDGGLADGGVTLDAGGSADAEAALDMSDPSDMGPDVSRPTPTDGGLVCGDFTAQAAGSVRPVDIVWIVDGSPSMDDEIAIIEANLNAWAGRIAASGLDYRVIIIGADREYCSDGQCFFEICLPQPLSGAAGCPDTDSDRYRHVRSGVHSRNGLDVAVATVDEWRPFLRANAALHVIMVTDDDQGWGVDADEFAAFLDQPGFGETVTFHSVIDEIGRLPNCGLFGDPPCSCGERRGETYVDLSARTGGVVRSICDADWDPIFGALEGAVVEGAGVPCAFDLPRLPEGVALDTDRVNVDLVRGGMDEPLDNVASLEACAGQPGWYYDDADAPTRLLLCPAACDAGAQEVRVEYGC
ncbi:MAG: hypothetical protein ACI9U2_004222, partial [Bradymonadia bacterium]